MNPLTTLEQAAVDAITRLVKQRGYPPTVRELGVLLGLKSTQSTHKLLSSLEHKGAIRREARQPRAITVVGGAR